MLLAPEFLAALSAISSTGLALHGLRLAGPVEIVPSSLVEGGLAREARFTLEGPSGIASLVVEFFESVGSAPMALRATAIVGGGAFEARCALRDGAVGFLAAGAAIEAFDRAKIARLERFAV